MLQVTFGGTHAQSETIKDEGFYLSESKKIALIGDYLMGGRVEGAFLSGKKLAEALARIRNSSRGLRLSS